MITKTVFLASFFLLCNAFVFAQKKKGGTHQSPRFNILFIAIDDLKPELGCYGASYISSPNIDTLAKSGIMFSSAYCQQAVCGPTRASLLTGMRPDKTKIWDLKTHLRDMNPDIVSIPQYFKANGYTTIGMGKIFDLSTVDNKGDSVSWSVPFMKTFPLAKGFEHIAFGIYQNPSVRKQAEEAGYADKEENDFYGKKINGVSRYSTECLDVPDDAYMDGAMANYAVNQLKQFKKSKQPFFLAVGFKKPHLPFIAPKKYWDLYDRNKISLAPFQEKAEGSPEFAYQNGGELRNYSADIEAATINTKGNVLQLTEEKQKELIHGYYACISYTDALVGKLMKALKETGLDKNTIVVLWGDHGWHLGDHSLWCKHTNFEQAVRVPLIIKMPGTSNGKQYKKQVEFVDIFPSLCELTGLRTPSWLDGKSLVPAMKNQQVIIKDFSISQYPRDGKDNPKEIMGYSLRTQRYRLTEWVGNNFSTSKVFNPKDVKAVELYDYQTDPLETKNLAKEPSMETVVKELTAKLHEFYNSQFHKLNQPKYK